MPPGCSERTQEVERAGIYGPESGYSVDQNGEEGNERGYQHFRHGSESEPYDEQGRDGDDGGYFYQDGYGVEAALYQPRVRHERSADEGDGCSERETGQRLAERYGAVSGEERQVSEQPREYDGRRGDQVHRHVGGARPNLPADAEQRERERGRQRYGQQNGARRERAS